jgi:hypothetical protein
MVIPLAMLHAPPKLVWPPERMANWQPSSAAEVLMVMVMAVETSSTVVGETIQRG